MDKKNGPWTILNTEIKYKSPWMVVSEDSVLTPVGKNSIYSRLETNDGVYVLPIDENGNVYLIDEFKYAIGKKLLMVTGGFINENEEPAEAAKRELEEEMGLKANQLESLGYLYLSPSMSTSKGYLFLAKNFIVTKTSHEETETIQVIKMTFSEAYKKVLSGEITHAQSCVLILRARLIIQKAID